MQAKESVQIPITRIADAELSPWPLPAESVEKGDPQASGAVLSKSPDSRIIRDVWACTPGRFRLMFTYDETVIVVQGTATVVMDNGSQVSLHPGDLAFFECGQGATWTVHENFRKAFHADSPDPLPF